MKLYCATGNAGKLREFRLAAENHALDLDALPGYGGLPVCEENGSTFEENAVLKARPRPRRHISTMIARVSCRPRCRA